MTKEQFISEVVDRNWLWSEQECPYGQFQGKKGYFVQSPERQIYVKEKGQMQPVEYVKNQRTTRKA